MKKILIVTTVSETLNSILAGQPRYLSETFNIYLACSNKAFFSQIEKKEEISPYYVPMVRGINPLYDCYSLIKMCLLILKIRPDVVHSYTPKAGMICMLGAFICRVPIRIHTFTGLIFPTATGIKQKILILIDKLICWCATKVVPEGSGVKRDLLNYKITAKPLDLIGNGNIAGIDTAFFCPAIPSINNESINIRTQLGISNTTFVFSFIGRLNRDKGVKELLAAFNLIRIEKKHLIIVGSIDTSAPISQSDLIDIQSHEKISWLGHLEDIRPVLHLSNTLVLPSYREGFPNVLLEAGAMEVACIATNVSGAAEIIDDSVTGYIVPVKDVAGLHARMEQIMQMPAHELILIGNAARVRIGELFEKANYLVKLVAFYRREINSYMLNKGISVEKNI